MFRTRTFVLALVGFALVSQVANRAVAQKVIVSRGFNYAIASFASGAERQAQPNLWVFEVQYKSLRMVEIPITDKKTGVKKKELIYYLVYKVVNRVIEQKSDDPERTPVNDFDKTPVPETFVPEIVFASNDNGDRRSIKDSIIPEAQKFIQAREQRKLFKGIKLLNTVEIVRKVPQAVPSADKEPPTLYGVAIFRGVNPATDFFTLYLSGFSNGYKLVNGPVSYDDLKAMADADELKVGDQIWEGNLKVDWKGAVEVGNLFKENNDPPANADTTQYYYTVTPVRADDNTQIWRKTIIQKYRRPGDRINQKEQEIRVDGDARWIFVPDDIDLSTDTPVSTAQGVSP